MNQQFAQLDNNGLVVWVIAAKSVEWCHANLAGVWVATFKDLSARKNFAGIGFAYDADRDAFIPPTPYVSWVLDEATCQWVAPVSSPDDGKMYTWDETITDWVEVQDETP